ncbi:hypothetical protein ZWY2020_026567 [Hordeum vulgare]|nr:hypothetical protein ZWY2020_026567 [Hordeum vulgare]
MDVERRKKLVEAAMDLGTRKNWGAYTGIFIALMLVIATIQRDEDYHDFADQRTLFLGIPNTLNVVSVIPFFFVGLAGLILNHCESYFRPCSQRAFYALFFAGVSVVGFGSFFYHLNPKNDTLFWDTFLMMIAFTSFEVIFIIERFDDWARTKSFASTSYWLWAAASIKAYFHGLLIGAQDDLPMGAQVIGVAGATCRGKHPVDWWFTYKRFKDKNLPSERMEEIVRVLV